MTMPKLFQVVTLYRMQEGSGETLYRVRVQEVGPNTLVLEVPLGPKSIPVRIPAGERVRLGYTIEHRAFYTFTTVALDVEGEDIPQLVVATPRQEDIRKVQRRNFFRVPVALEGKLKRPDGRGVPVHVCDLSGGGFSFKSRLPWLALEQELSGTIRLPQSDVEFAAIVRRLEYLEEVQLHLYGLEFTQLLNAHRNKIVKYCLERQSKLLRISPP
ncbi:PilZ domain-containing protein [Tumebacillus sp. ITR2]|uniref:PilZ domain-containing protein n=1 Tax=Tumebacillus amylolyticus TaxID=2801339 RepID=A0ABS1JHS8_9BACL|nr:PilZ domain-containing protein [Tumebacillus amylolyticus]MBL0389338.1 PilZ domain-containing protein [Tumebacillus amylolyticus]